MLGRLSLDACGSERQATGSSLDAVSDVKSTGASARPRLMSDEAERWLQLMFTVNDSTVLGRRFSNQAGNNRAIDCVCIADVVRTSAQESLNARPPG